MTVSDEALMAYADGEADAAMRALIEEAMRDDPDVGRRIAQHRAMREAMRKAFSAVLDEPVPQRLIDAARGNSAAAAGHVVDLAATRASAREAQSPREPRKRLRSRLPLAMAASLLLGLALGYLGWHGSGVLMQAGASGELIATAGLAEALSAQLSADRPPGSAATTGLSFRTKAGNYCRTFSLTGTSGLACREGNSWKIKALAQVPRMPSNSGDFRPAASADIPAIRAAVEESIDGEPLDQAGEIAARRQNWDATAPR
jgi:hypothetical protein